MEYYGNNDYRDYLAIRHHGILGMKWGKRNGPPYPLGSSEHSASEKKAGWRKSLGGGSSTAVRKKARYITKESKRIEKRYNKDIKKSDKQAARAEKKYEKASEKGSSRAERLNELYRDKLVDSESLKRIKEKELDRVRNMSLKDIKEEKRSAKAKKNQLRSRISDSDGIATRVSKERQNRKEVEKYKSENRVSKGERNQIKEEARKEINSGFSEYAESVNKGRALSKTVLSNPSRKLSRQEMFDLDDYVGQLFAEGTTGGPGEEWVSKQKEQEYYKLRKYLDKNLY